MINAEAYAQVSYIISKMSKKLKNKIPYDVIDIIENNKDKRYVINEEVVKNIELLPDTEKLLSVLYTDYIATDEEKAIIKNKEKMIYFNKEDEKRKIYSTDVFIDCEKNKEKLIRDKNIALQVIKKEKWYKKILRKIRERLKW